MAMKMRFIRTPEFLIGKATGKASIDEFIDLIELAARHTKETGDLAFLADLREVQGSLAFTEHFRIGEQVSRQLSHLQKVASVVPPSRRTGTSERVSQRMGMRLRVFEDIDEAIRWLGE